MKYESMALAQDALLKIHDASDAELREALFAAYDMRLAEMGYVIQYRDIFQYKNEKLIPDADLFRVLEKRDAPIFEKERGALEEGLKKIIEPEFIERDGVVMRLHGDDGLEIAKVLPGENRVIPAQVDGRRVHIIARDAFEGFDAEVSFAKGFEMELRISGMIEYKLKKLPGFTAKCLKHTGHYVGPSRRETYEWTSKTQKLLEEYDMYAFSAKHTLKLV